jgi:hypothetical protein
MKRLHSHTQLVGLHRVNWTLIDWSVASTLESPGYKLEWWMMRWGDQFRYPKTLDLIRTIAGH